MLSADLIRFCLPLLIALPILSSVVMFLFRKNDKVVKQSAIALALLNLLVTGLVVNDASKLLTARSVPVAQNQAPPDLGKLPAPQPVPKKGVAPDPKIVAANLEKQRQHNIEKQKALTIEKQKVVSPEFVTRFPILSLGSENPRIKGIYFFIGLDGLNVWLIGLVGLMMLPIVLVSNSTVLKRMGPYFTWLFLLQAAVIGVFLSFDILMFYICFELTLIPIYFLIGNWGNGPVRREAARKLFLFTLTGGLITLLGIIGIVLMVYLNPFAAQSDRVLTFSIPELAENIQKQIQLTEIHLKTATDPQSGLSESERGYQLEEYRTKISFWQHRETFLFMALAIGFLVKIPVIPFHSWLPDAYSQAPIGVTLMLSSLLAKMGTFGLLRICLPLTPDGAVTVGLEWVGTLASIGIVYGALTAYAQSSMTRLVAYSSISHLGLCVLGLMAFNVEGLTGSTLHMVNHGISTGGIFLLIGYIAKRYHSLEINDFSGLWNKLPVLTFFMMMLALSSVGLPGLNNFISEMLIFASVFDLHNSQMTGTGFGIAVAIGLFLGAWYTMTLIYRTFFGPLKEPPALQTPEVTDLSWAETGVVGLLVACCLAIGVMPQALMDPMKKDVERMQLVATDARDRLLPPPSLPSEKAIDKQ